MHDTAFDIIKSRFSPQKSLRVLDTATGTGSFAQRALDSFPDWDLEVNDFENQAISLDLKRYKLDLNLDFSDGFAEPGYDLILAIEIIEHLENPWHFMREVRKLLRKDGVLVLSTPNSDSALDRLTYLMDGHAFYFGERGYTNSGGHITQIPDWLFKKIAKSSYYSSVELISVVDTAPLIGLLVMLKLLLFMPLAGVYMRNKNKRSINVYIVVDMIGDKINLINENTRFFRGIYKNHKRYVCGLG